MRRIEFCQPVQQTRGLQSFKPVFRIHDILVWIRIRVRISGPMPLTNGQFSSLTFKMPTKTNFLANFFCLLLYEGTLTSFFTDKKSKRVTDSRFFLLFLDPDPDPEHWFKQFLKTKKVHDSRTFMKSPLSPVEWSRTMGRSELVLNSKKMSPLVRPISKVGSSITPSQKMLVVLYSTFIICIAVLRSGSGSVCFGPPGSGSGSISQRYGSGTGSFYHQAKKKIGSYCFVTSFLTLHYFFF